MASPGSILSDLRLFAKYHLVRRVFDYPAPETALGIERLDYDADAYTRQLQGYADHFEIDCLNEVTYRERKHPIHRLRKSGDADERKSLLVLCGVHGNEYAGLLAVPPLLERVVEDPKSFAHLDLCIVAPVNPVGARECSRYNAEGYDVNRDFKRFDTPEARAVRQAIDEAQPDFILSLHEGPHAGSFLFANQDVDPSLAAPVLEKLEQAGTQLSTVDYFGRTLDTPGYAPLTPTLKIAGWLWAATLGMMSSGVYAHARRTPEITLESSWREAGDVRVLTHVACVMAVVEWLRESG